MSNTMVDELKTLYLKMGGKFADIKDLQTDAELIDKIEDIGSAYLTVSNGTENYKLFIEGYKSLADPNVLYDAGGQFDYNQYKDIEGYADYTNNHGAVPVTAELKDFLQKLSISQLYFRDGNGWCEISSPYPVDSTEEDQWLFACGYYS